METKSRGVTLRIIECRPGQPAPESGWYQQIRVLGSATGDEVFVEQGAPLPDAALGFSWRLKPPPLSELSAPRLRERAAAMRDLAHTARTTEAARGLLRLAERFEKLACDKD